MAARGPFDPKLVHTDEVIESVPDGARFGAVIVNINLKKESEEVEIKDTYIGPPSVNLPSK